MCCARLGEVVGVERPQQRVRGDPGVEAVDEVDEERLATHASYTLTRRSLERSLRWPWPKKPPSGRAWAW